MSRRSAPDRRNAGDGLPPGHWAGIAESTCVWGIWTLYAVHRLFGRTLFRAVLYPVVFYYWLTRPSARRASLDYLRRVHAANGNRGPMPGWWDTLDHMLGFGETLLDKMLAIGGRYRFGNVTREGHEVLLRQIASGKGGIIVTAHMGCLELCRALASRHQGLHLNVLVHTMHAQRFNNILARLDPNANVRLIQVTEIGPATALLLEQKVAAGEFVAIAGDRVPVAGARTITVPFLGAPARLPIGPYALAALLGCPLYAMGCVRQRDGYLLRFTELARDVRLPRKDRDAALAVYGARYAQWIADLLKTSPRDWFNFYPFWEGGEEADAPTLRTP